MNDSKPKILNLNDLESRMNRLSAKPTSLGGLGRRSLDETNRKPPSSLSNLRPSSGDPNPFSLNLKKDPPGSFSETSKSSMKMPIFPGGSQLNNMPQKKTIRFDIPPEPEKSAESDKLNARLQLVLKQNGKLRFGQNVISTDVKSFDNLGEIGFGTCGQVFKMRHRPTQAIMAVKQMARTGNREENKRIMMDLEVVQKSHDCPHIVTCFGTFVTESHFWICMELMETCFDKLKKKINGPLPENIIGKLSVSVVKALHYLKEKHDVIHRDVKPSNILVSRGGQVKLCDFGISGRLVDSKAKTRNAGCVAYMAPERISPEKVDYDIRADVWSLGISLIELATGSFPYCNCQTDFEMLTLILDSEPPSLPTNMKFSMDFRRFVTLCCTKKYEERPKYRDLLTQEFVTRYERTQVDIGGWLKQVYQPSGAVGVKVNNQQVDELNNLDAFVQKKSSTLPRLGAGSEGGFSLAAFAKEEKKSAPKSKADPFAFVDNLTQHFTSNNKSHTRNRSWAASFDFLKLNSNNSAAGGSSSSSSSMNQKASSSSSSLHPPPKTNRP